MKYKLKASTVAVVGALQASLIASMAIAQTAPAKIEEQKVEKVEVTGSRLPAANLEGASPVTVLDAAAIKVDGVRSVENLLNNLPQVFADQGGTISNGSSGTATVNLRGLGPTRTLVLVNGKRLPGGSPRAGTASAAADLNQVPAPLIKRVEILTGGAGAVYGSDAVAGVVNFIMNNKFEGVQIEANQSFYNHEQQNPSGIADVIRGRAATNPSQFAIPGDKSADGKIYDANILMGSNFANGKGNATVFFSYKKEDALLQSERDFSACAAGSTNTAFTCGGSSTAAPARVLILSTGASRIVTNAAGNTRAFNAGLDQYNFAPTNFYQRPSERYGFNASANYDLAENVNLYSEFSFHDDRTVAQIAPSGLFFGGATFNMRFENPLLSADWKRDMGLLAPGDTAAVFVGRRNVEGGGRQDDIRHTSYRTIIGAKGDFAKAWSYDVFMQTAKVIYQETYKNEFSFARGQNALDVVSVNGVPTCRSVVNGTDPNCVPYNLWVTGGVTAAALGYIQTPGFQKGDTSQTVAGGTISGDLGLYGMKLPGAKTGIGVVFGVEQRTEKLQLDTDTAFTTGDLAGQGGPTIGVVGKYTVKDIFTEARVPILEGVPMAHLLSFNGSYRRSDYSINQATDSYGLGLEWAPVQAVRLRGSFQKAARAANIHELFDAQAIGLFNSGADPCGGPTPTATLAQCQRTGITAATYGQAILNSPAGQYNALFGGNPNLKPEESESSTVGVVLEPMRNMSITIDAFDIKMTDVISTLPPNVVLANCLATGQFCNLIQRDIIGSLWAAPQGRIVATNVNVAALRSSGIDVGFNYAHKLPQMGTIAVNLNGTLLTKAENEPIPGAGAYDCKGLHGPTCGVPAPKWRHKLRGTWTTPWNWDLSLTWRHIDKVNNEATSTNTLLNGAINDIDKTLAAREYFDISGSWSVTKQLTLRGGINNLLDKDPPIMNQTSQAAVFGNGNTYPQVYDTLGRRVFINATYKF